MNTNQARSSTTATPEAASGVTFRPHYVAGVSPLGPAQASAYATLPRGYPPPQVRPQAYFIRGGPLHSSDRGVPLGHRTLPSPYSHESNPTTTLDGAVYVLNPPQSQHAYQQRPLSPSATLPRRSEPPQFSHDPLGSMSGDHMGMTTPLMKGYVACIVTMLDGSEQTFEVKRSSKGLELFDMVCQSLDLQEREYFGLMGKGADNVWSWLDLRKKIAKYMSSSPWRFDLQMKFYPPEPSDLRDELTRYLLCLQIRQDLVCKKLPCSFATYVLLSAYIIQSEVGDYDVQLHGNAEYMKDMLLLPEGVMTPEMMTRIMEVHKLLKGQRPDEADAHFLENAKKMALYGVDFHKVRDNTNEEFMIGVYHSGVLVYLGRLRINKFVWAKIIKISYLRCHFRLFLRHSENELQDKYVEFRCETPKLAKRLWRSCVEYHSFFRLRDGRSSFWKRSTVLPAFSHRTFHYSAPAAPHYNKPASSVAPIPTSGDAAADVTLRKQPRVNRQPANRLSWRPRDNAYITPTFGNRHSE